MNIKLIHKQQLLEILKKNKSRSKIFNALNLYSGSTLDLPSEFRVTAFSNDLRNGVIREELIVGLVYLILSDHKPDTKYNFNYTLEDFQKVFAHFDKRDIKKLGDDKREKLNTIISELSSENDKFADVFLDENWDIQGDKTISLEEYKHSLKKEHPKWWKEIGSSLLISPKVLYILGFSLFFVPFVVWPIVVVGFYKNNVSRSYQGQRWKINVSFILMLILNISVIGGGYHFFEKNYLILNRHKPKGEFYSEIPTKTSNLRFFQETRKLIPWYMSNLQPGESESIFLSHFYGNKGDGPIYNAELKYYFDQVGKTKEASFFIVLKGENTDPMYNEFILKRMPEQWKIDVVCIRIIQEHSPCAGYEYLSDIAVTNNRNGSIPLGDLDTQVLNIDGKVYKCDYGFVEIDFVVTNSLGTSIQF